MNNTSLAIPYLENQEVKALLECAPRYTKAALTELRLPTLEELGQELLTYVRDESQPEGVRVESRNTIASSHVIARNPGVVGVLDGREIANEWLIERATAERNYGGDVVGSLGTSFTSHRKVATVGMIPLDRTVLDLLGVSGPELAFPVSWSEHPMVAREGDFLTDAGYSVGAHEMETYVRVEPVVENNSSRPTFNLR